jgi:hypothetical protein
LVTAPFSFSASLRTFLARHASSMASRESEELIVVHQRSNGYEESNRSGVVGGEVEGRWWLNGGRWRAPVAIARRGASG